MSEHWMDRCRRCDRPVRFDGPFCSDECRESHEAECTDDGDDDGGDGTYVEDPDHKPASSLRDDESVLGGDLDI